MKVINFSRPGNVLGVGFLIVFGGVPQFSIAWDATREPERISLSDAQKLDFSINGKPASSFVVVENNDAFELQEASVEPVDQSEENDESTLA